MSIYDHFSDRTTFPVKIDEVRDFIVGSGVVDDVDYCAVDIDSRHLRGVSRLSIDIPIPRPYAEETTVARVYYCEHLPLPEQRLVVCKELLHTLDFNGEAAQSEEQVSDLIDQLSYPLSTAADLSKLGLPTISDNLGEVRALAVLCPLAGVRICRNLIENGNLGHSDFAAMAEIPERYAPLVLGRNWEKIAETIKVLGDRTCDPSCG